ncbi:hypothetical protein AUK22_09045 [bacterium CG2_30_54_10]|nr:MAG: hypothetical protein AUK22_09045 [bacterium CG2_30_54_10]
MKNNLQGRQQALAASFPKKVEALLVMDFSNIRYLCGFSGSAGALLVERDHSTFFTDFRYQEQSALEIGSSAKIVVYKTSAIEAVTEFLKGKEFNTVAVEGSLRVDLMEAFSKGFEGKLVVALPLVEKLRQIKDREELKCLERAFEISDRSFERLLEFIKPGRTELEVAAKLEYIMRREGSDGASFSTIVAAGEHASCPHASPSERVLKLGEMLKIDFGATSNGYHSDMTRTLFLGKADKKFREIYRIVRKAQKKAISKIEPGVKCFDVDKVARDYIAKKGYGDNFGHGLGHSLGLDIHESPAYSTKSKDTISAGMVLTVEPGIYIPGWGGIRIEDTYIVADGEPIRLTKTPNKLLEIC